MYFTSISSIYADLLQVLLLSTHFHRHKETAAIRREDRNPSKSSRCFSFFLPFVELVVLTLGFWILGLGSLVGRFGLLVAGFHQTGEQRRLRRFFINHFYPFLGSSSVVVFW